MGKAEARASFRGLARREAERAGMRKSRQEIVLHTPKIRAWNEFKGLMKSRKSAAIDSQFPYSVEIIVNRQVIRSGARRTTSKARTNRRMVQSKLRAAMRDHNAGNRPEANAMILLKRKFDSIWNEAGIL